MNYTQREALGYSCFEECTGKCVVVFKDDYYQIGCFTNYQYVFCHNKVSIGLSFITLAINIIVYLLTCCCSKLRSNAISTIVAMLANVFSLLFISSITCIATFTIDGYWLGLFIGTMFIFLLLIGYYFFFICAFKKKCSSLLFTFWDYDVVDDNTVDDYLNQIYDNPPIFTMKFDVGSIFTFDDYANKFYSNVKYGSWELASERIHLEDNKFATIIVPTNEYLPDKEFEEALLAKKETTKSIVSKYFDLDNIRESPDVKCETYDVSSQGKIYTQLCFYKFMKGWGGKIINSILIIFGLDVIIENIFWLLVKIINVDNVKKVSKDDSKGKGFSTPAYVVKGKDKSEPVLTEFEDKLPDSFTDEQYYKISDNPKGTRPVRNVNYLNQAPVNPQPYNQPPPNQAPVNPQPYNQPPPNQAPVNPQPYYQPPPNQIQRNPSYDQYNFNQAQWNPPGYNQYNHNQAPRNPQNYYQPPPNQLPRNQSVYNQPPRNQPLYNQYPPNQPPRNQSFCDQYNLNQRERNPDRNYGNYDNQRERIPNDNIERSVSRKERRPSNTNGTKSSLRINLIDDDRKISASKEEGKTSSANVTKSSPGISSTEDKSFDEKPEKEDVDRSTQIASTSGIDEAPENEEC